MLSSERWCAQLSKKSKWWLNPVLHRMLYRCTLMASLGVKG